MRILKISVALLLIAPVALAESDDEPPEGAILAPVGNSAADIRETLALPAATWYNDRDGNKIFDSLEALFDDDPDVAQPVIVTFREDAEVTTALAAAQLVVGHWSPSYIYHNIGGFAAKLHAQDVEALAAITQVRQIEWSQPGQPELDTATETMGVRAVQQSIQPASPPGADPGITGEGVVIAIMDSGFDGDHVDLDGQILRFIDWSDNGAEVDPYDGGNHGTHVASIALGLGIGNPAYTGVAPGAKMIGFRIQSDDTKAAAIASADWILDHPEEQVRVSTISYGFGRTSDGTDALELAMDRLWEGGVVPFKSNGNSGPEKGTVTIPGGARGILSTGAIYDPGEDGVRLRPGSSRGPTEDGRIKPDIVAPGSTITAAAEGTHDGYRASSGTSMASPFAAGVAALMISADGTLTNADVRRIIEDTAWNRGPAGPDIDWGAGQVDGLRAVQQVLLERAIREALPWSQVAAWNVTGPAFLGHQYIELSGPSGADSFEVLEAGQTLGVTLLADGLEGGGQGTRAITAFIDEPDGDRFVFSPFSAISRQQTHNAASAINGTYQVSATGLDGGNGVNVDVVGAVALVGNPYILPGDADAYQELGGPGGAEADNGAAGPVGALAFAGVTGLVYVRRRAG